ncbi:hypothetical protein GCM10025868_41120 [Angustibacter aerolatus]|uniref:Uncharacterized protein n=1 Tax=Angustibacter aerolatus TaxID=1162965 RepID=A0ABQ6JPU3_9ACTN|nr:hypothetical protein GCM10025868_41120 [Angustibacter aerolatus]
MLLTDLPAQASQVAERVASGIVDALREPFVLDAVTLQVGASVGVSVVGPGDHGAAAEPAAAAGRPGDVRRQAGRPRQAADAARRLVSGRPGARG